MRLGTPSGLSTMSTGRTVLQVRHVLFRKDAGDDALVAVTAGHLVADLQLALDGDVDLHHLDHARRKLVALGEAIDLVAEVLFANADDVFELAQLLLRFPRRSSRRGISPQYLRGISSRAGLVDGLRPSGEGPCPCRRRACRSSSARRASSGCGGRTSRGGSSISSSRVLLEAGALVCLRCRVARSSFSVPLREKMRALMTMPPTPGGTLSELSRTSPAFSPKIARRSFSSGESCVSPFGVILPTRMSPGFTSAPMRTMPRSSRSLRASSPTFGMSRVTLFLAELRVAGDALELLDVDRGEHVVLGDALGDEDRVLEVVALPRHERDEHVLAERELAHVARRAVGEDVAGLHRLARADDRLLVVAGRLVRALELGQSGRCPGPRRLSPSARTTMRVASTLSTMPSRLATTQTPESRASVAFHAGADERRMRSG